MADINTSPASDAALRGGSDGQLASDQPPGEDALIAIVELLFFAYRDFTLEADAALAELGFGRAHHRVLHFVNRKPGMRVADLLDILRITKQSLARVLKELVDRGFIAQEAGAQDRRERRLFLTDTGGRLATRLAQLQTARIRDALAAAGPDAEEVAQAFLLGIVGPEHRVHVIGMLRSLEAERGRDFQGAKEAT